MTILANLRLKGAVLPLLTEVSRIHIVVLSSHCLQTADLIYLFHTLGHSRVRELLFGALPLIAPIR